MKHWKGGAEAALFRCPSPRKNAERRRSPWVDEQNRSNERDKVEASRI
jgi:hypothetical protein